MKTIFPGERRDLLECTCHLLSRVQQHAEGFQNVLQCLAGRSPLVHLQLKIVMCSRVSSLIHHFCCGQCWICVHFCCKLCIIAKLTLQIPCYILLLLIHCFMCFFFFAYVSADIDTTWQIRLNDPCCWMIHAWQQCRLSLQSLLRPKVTTEH